MVRISNGLVQFLMYHKNKPIGLSIKETPKRSLSGLLMDFDESVILLNPFIEKSSELRGTPMVIDIDSIVTLYSLDQEDFGSFAHAFEEYRHETAQCWTCQGNELYEMGKYIDSLEYYRQAVDLDPKYAEAWYNIGLAFKALQRFSEANAAISKARELGYKG